MEFVPPFSLDQIFRNMVIVFCHSRNDTAIPNQKGFFLYCKIEALYNFSSLELPHHHSLDLQIQLCGTKYKKNPTKSIKIIPTFTISFNLFRLFDSFLAISKKGLSYSSLTENMPKIVVHRRWDGAYYSLFHQQCLQENHSQLIRLLFARIRL